MSDATIVYVHGNGNKVRRELLKSRWDRALFGADLGPASRMAYWAALRYAEPLPDDGGADPSEGGARNERELPVAGLPETPEEFVERTLGEVRSSAGPATGPATETAAGSAAGRRAGEPAGETRLARWLARMTYAAQTLDRGEDGGPAPAPGEGQRVLPLPLFLRSPVFKSLLRHTYEDVHAYFFGGFGEAMRETVRAQLAAAGGGPLVVVGHSLGTIIAYEVLREERRRDVDLFVTVGSPLGITEIQDLLVRPPAVPACVKAWCNASDLRDLVALDHWLRAEYPPPARVTDHLVRNDSANHHGISEYLASAPVQSQVRAVFGRLAGAPAG
ncbi:esterase/lipase family protein [Streptomyces antimicrobicus]|uniref:Lipase family protein n=1 Tax=Streptomyces antimicrobicus TaxID=2883108 RepID=A0ABS8BEG5_9ACTN|nr:lipase family protein [Streptomyces antimicrobicus]MCB5183035.1 lipase family protein [Streptomyces antimicrobicus]